MIAELELTVARAAGAGTTVSTARAHDGASWTVGAAGFATRGTGDRSDRIDLGTTADLTAVYAVGDEIVVLASDGVIRRWRDGRVRAVATGVSARLTGLAAMRGIWVVVGAGGLVLRSPDGEWFSRARSGVETDLEAITAAADHLLVAVGANGCVLVSRDDGRKWQVMTIPGAPHLRAVEPVDGGVVIRDDRGEVARLGPRGDAPAPVATAPAPVTNAGEAEDDGWSDEPAPAPTPVAVAEKAANDPARVEAALALSARALRLAPDDEEVQLVHAMLLVEGARSGVAGALGELRDRLASFAPATRAQVTTRLGELGVR